MATIQRSNTKVANKLISYAEKRAEMKEGINCPSDYAKAQFKATRELWGKNDNIQAHHVIQSFKPDEVTPELANQLGQDLAKKIAEGHEVVVYTHTDKDHIHNHIVINSVNFETGKKYHSHGKEELYKIREASDQLCKEHNLFVIKEPYANERSHLAEHGLAEKGVMSWKQEIRGAVNDIRERSTSYEDFKKNLTEEYGIQVKERGKHITFIHPENNRKVRGNKLGKSYERGTLANEYSRQAERETTNRNKRGTNSTIESDRGLSVNVSEREYEQRNSDNKRTGRNQENEPTDPRGNEINIAEINKQLSNRKRGLQESYKQQHGKTSENGNKIGKGTGHEQNYDREGIERDKAEQSKKPRQSEREEPELDR